MSGRETEILIKMSASLEKAVKSLVLTSFPESYDVGWGHAKRVSLETTHDAIIYLIRRGIKDIVVNIDNQLDETNEKMSSLQELLTFFKVHPLKTKVQAVDFCEGSATAKLIGRWTRHQPRDSTLELNAAEVEKECASAKDVIVRLNKVREILKIADIPTS